MVIDSGIFDGKVDIKNNVGPFGSVDLPSAHLFLPLSKLDNLFLFEGYPKSNFTIFMDEKGFIDILFNNLP